jgi:cytochrome c-type biogenesis protein CcmH
MNTEITLIFLIISIFGSIAFWLMYRKANNTKAQAQQYLIASLQDESLSSEERESYEKKLSGLLQKNTSKGSVLISLSLALFLTAPSFLLYQKYGTPNAKNLLKVASIEQSAPGQNSAEPQLSMQDAIAQLEQRLSQNPDDVDGQMLYARSQVSLQKYANAVAAYRKANQLAPNESVILTELAEAIALNNNNRSFLGESEALLAQAVELEPTNQKALWLLGMTFYEKKNFVKTNEIWTNLYALMTNEGAKEQLFEQLTEVRNKLGIDTKIISSAEGSQQKEIQEITTTANRDENSLITLQVNIDDSLLNNLKDKRALLYVYTKELTGMPMPIAVIRQPLEQINKTFPISLIFSDDNSLQPSRLLSNFDNVIIGARVSFTGNATPQAGDLQSTEIKIDLSNADNVQLTIDSVR